MRRARTNPNFTTGSGSITAISSGGAGSMLPIGHSVGHADVIALASYLQGTVDGFARAHGITPAAAFNSVRKQLAW